MADEDDYPAGETEECREPTLKDLEEVCLHLNAQGARYVVVGGFAIRAAGLLRRTMDIDLLKLAEMGTPVPEAPTPMFLPRWLEHLRQWLVRRLGGRP